MKPLLLATTNKGKILELRALLAPLPYDLHDLSQLPDLAAMAVEETGETFSENALIKACAYAEESGMMTVADDSGLAVDALNGRPGVFSKRYGATDAARIIRLLDELRGVPETKRTARFVSAAAVYDPASGQDVVTEGQVEGFITTAPMGTHGFGYDPVFFCPELGKTFGEASEEEKNSVSHRSRAIHTLIAKL